MPHNIFGTTSSQKGKAISPKIYSAPLGFCFFRSPITEKDIETMKKRKEGDSGGRGPLGEKEEKRRARHKEQKKGTPLFFALHCSPHPVLSSPHPLSLFLLLSLPPCISPFSSLLLSSLVPACWLLAFSFRYPSFCNFLLTCQARATFLLSLPFLSYLSFKKGIGKTARIRKRNKKIPGKSSPAPSHYLLDLSTCLCFLFS